MTDVPAETADENENKPIIRLVNKAKSPVNDMVIRAYVPAEKGHQFYPITFLRERIERLVGLNDEDTGIVLKDGTQFAVNLPIDLMEQKIYNPYPTAADVVDLLPFTGAAVEAKLPKLSKQFNQKLLAKLKDEEIQDVPLTLAFFARSSGAGMVNTKLVIVKEEDIDWGETKQYGPYRTRVVLANGEIDPFGDQEDLIVDMPHDDFIAHYNQAKIAGDKQLDLRQETAQKLQKKSQENLPKFPDMPTSLRG